MKPQDLIRAAAKIIETQGWCSGLNNAGHVVHVRDQSGIALPLYRGDNSGQDKAKVNPGARSFSIYGALCKAMDDARGTVADPGLMWDTLHRVGVAEGARTGGTNYVHPVMQINEQEGQTKDGVLAFLERVAVEIEGDVQPPADPETAATEIEPIMWEKRGVSLEEARAMFPSNDEDEGETEATVEFEPDFDLFEPEIIPPGPYVDPHQRGAEPDPADLGLAIVHPTVMEALREPEPPSMTHTDVTAGKVTGSIKAPVPQIKADPKVEETKSRLPPIGWGEA